MTRRADRLFEIIQLLREARGPLTAEVLARRLETSRRSVYRDIAALMAQRVPIRGEAGVGYVLDRGFDLPPLMITAEEAEAAALGAQWVLAHADEDLARAARAVLAKIAAVLPEDLRAAIDDPVVGTPPSLRALDDAGLDWRRLREWSRRGRKLAFTYVDEAGRGTTRTVWPFMIGFVERARVVVAWCELREDFRIFRTDRMADVDFIDERYPAHAIALRRRWLAVRADARG